MLRARTDQRHRRTGASDCRLGTGLKTRPSKRNRLRGRGYARHVGEPLQQIQPEWEFEVHQHKGEQEVFEKGPLVLSVSTPTKKFSPSELPRPLCVSGLFG